MIKPASAAQIRYAKHLMAAQGYPEHPEGATRVEDMTMAQARYLISILLKYPRVAPAQTKSQAPEPAMAPKDEADTIKAGMYRTNSGDILRVYMGQNSGVLLVKRVVFNENASYEYIGSLAYVQRGRTRLGRVELSPLSLDEAKAWGRTTGHCCVCARLLTDPESVDAGIGPVCAGKF